MRRLLLPLTLCALLLPLSPASSFADDFDDLELDEPAPDFTLRDLADREFTLSDEEGESVVVIQFGSSTTQSYIEQIRSMNDLIRSYRREGVTFLTVYTVEQGFSWQAEDYFEKYERAAGLRFQYGVQSGTRMGTRILVDELDEAVHQAYGSVPAGVFIVDEDGNLVYKARALDTDDLNDALKEIL